MMRLLRMYRCPASILIVIVVCVGIGLVSLWSLTPKKGVLRPEQPELGHGYYYGLGLTNEPAMWGRRYVRIEVPLTLPEDGFCVVYCESLLSITPDGHRLYRFIARYPNGVIRAEGLCTLTYLFDQPYSIGEIWDGSFYDPTGESLSRITDGSGVETYWTRDGVKTWELVLHDLERQHLKTWHRNGQLRAEYSYKNGSTEGLVQFFNEDGSRDGIIVYENGFEKARVQQ